MQAQLHIAYTVKQRIAVSPFQAIYDSILNLAASVCETEFAIISIKETYRHLFISTIGINGLKEVALNDSFCAYATESSLIQVEDASKDTRFSQNPYVINEPYIRFYAGIPVYMPLGEQIGTICVFDKTPKLLNQNQTEILMGLSKIFFNTLVANDVVLKQLSDCDYCNDIKP